MRAVAVMPRDAVAATNTLLQVYAADSNRPLKITEIGVSFFGVTSTDTPIHVQIVRQSTAGTGGTSVTPRSMDPDSGSSIQGTAQRKPTSANWTAEPTATYVLREFAIHPQSGLLLPIPDPEAFVVDGGEYLGIYIATAPTSSTPMTAYIEWEE